VRRTGTPLTHFDGGYSNWLKNLVIWVDKLTEAHRENKSIVLTAQQCWRTARRRAAEEGFSGAGSHRAADGKPPRSSRMVAIVGKPSRSIWSEEIADCLMFPIEFVDMSQVRHVLYAKIRRWPDVQTQNLRHQLEYALRAVIEASKALHPALSKCR
jgi:hypothetical protein